MVALDEGAKTAGGPGVMTLGRVVMPVKPTGLVVPVVGVGPTDLGDRERLVGPTGPVGLVGLVGPTGPVAPVGSVGRGSKRRSGGWHLAGRWGVGAGGGMRRRTWGSRRWRTA